MIKKTMNCVICNGSSFLYREHLLLKEEIYKCSSCFYHFVNCSNFNEKDIFDQQNNNSGSFGGNFSRNSKYLSLLKKQTNIKSILEIGTPDNYGFLEMVFKEFGKTIEINSHDLIKNNFPSYINFYSNKDELLRKEIDLLFCIHTLEHIPTNHLLEFISFCKSVSKKYIFEVPCCETLTRVLKSSTQPHYSFFSELSLKVLFEEDLILNKTNEVIRFTNLEELNILI